MLKSSSLLLNGTLDFTLSLMEALDERSNVYLKIEWEKVCIDGEEFDYMKRILESSLSGHVYRNSPFETDDSCGNCDGARCDSCREIYVLTEYGTPRIDEIGAIIPKLIRYRTLRTAEEKEEALNSFN